jgi:hypothetical protein
MEGRAKIQYRQAANTKWIDGLPPRIGKQGVRIMIRYVWLEIVSPKSSLSAAVYRRPSLWIRTKVKNNGEEE